MLAALIPFYSIFAFMIFYDYCGMDVPLSDDKHRFVRDNSKKCNGVQDKFSLRQDVVQDKIQSEKISENFFFLTKFFFR